MIRNGWLKVENKLSDDGKKDFIAKDVSWYFYLTTVKKYRNKKSMVKKKAFEFLYTIISKNESYI